MGDGEGVGRPEDGPEAPGGGSRRRLTTIGKTPFPVVAVGADDVDDIVARIPPIGGPVGEGRCPQDRDRAHVRSSSDQAGHMGEGGPRRLGREVGLRFLPVTA